MTSHSRPVCSLGPSVMRVPCSTGMSQARAVTLYHAAMGRDAKDNLAQFGEVVHARVPDPMKGGGAAPRWYLGIWAGLSGDAGNHVVLKENRANVVRVVKRLVAKEQWQPARLASAAGSPLGKE